MLAWLGLEWMGWQDWAGALCYTILAASYLVTSMLWLRALAVVALAMEAVYFVFAADEPLWVGIFWNGVFVAINVIQLWRLVHERMRSRLSTEEAVLHQGPFANFTRHGFHRLLRAGTWRDLPIGAELTRENEPVPELLVVGSGIARVMVRGKEVALVQPGALIGEMSMVMQTNATATVVAATPCRVFGIDKRKLSDLCAEDTAVSAAMQGVIGRDLAKKLAQRNA